MSDLRFVALLPMKGHSERIKNKNFRLFKGKPLFQWILEELLSIESIKTIIINTDVVEKLRQYPFMTNDRVLLRSRPKELIGDHVSMNRIIESDLEFANADHYIMTHTTNPLIKATTILEGMKKYEDILSAGFDSLFSANRYLSRFYSSELKPMNHNPQNLIRTQDLDPIYEENSCLYYFNNNSFVKTKARIGAKPTIFITPKIESIDIDDWDSWDQAILAYNYLYNNEV